MSNTPESNEVGAHQFRLAQARRLMRFCAAHGLDIDTVSSEDIAPILDARGKIMPEQQDYED